MAVLYILLCVLILVMVGGYLGFLYAFARTPDPDWDDQTSLDRSMWKNHPVSIPAANQWLRDHHAEEVSTVSFDGLPLRGKWVPAEHPKATIILFHGYRSSYLTDFGGIFQAYHDLGLNLLLVRQRSHGESEGKYITFGVHERKDVLSWIDFHNRTHGADNLFLGGMSMGASTVLFAAGEDLPENVRGITADCGFTSPYDIIGKVARTGFHLPPRLVLPLLNIYTRRLAGFDLKECATTDTLKRAKVPILMIHGKADDFVPWEMSQAGFDACASEKQLFLAENAGHGMSYLLETERLTQTLVDFFLGHLTARTQLEETK